MKNRELRVKVEEKGKHKEEDRVESMNVIIGRVRQYGGVRRNSVRVRGSRSFNICLRRGMRVGLTQMSGIWQLELLN